MTAIRNLIHPRDEIMQTMERIYRYRMTTTSGGNISIREPNGDVWITPARVDKGSLTRGDIVCVRSDGTVEGPHRPSSEYPFHRDIYAACPDLSGIVHAHPVALVAFSICGLVPETRLFHQSREICGKIGFAPYALPGSDRLARQIADVFVEGARCVVLENHGVVVGGATLRQAFERFETLEFTAKTAIKARHLGEIRCLSDEQLELALHAIPPLPSFTPELATSRERELRRQLCDFTRRGYRQRLLISTEGTFSARLDQDSFLITPRHVDREAISLNDLVLVRHQAAEVGKVASRASRNHAAIYARHPEVHAIINADPVNATAFSITQAELDTRTIPESYIFLREVRRLPFGVQFTDPAALSAYVSANHPLAVQENDGVLVLGKDILDAFDRLEVLESTAEAIINSRALGEVRPMSNDVIRELREVFSL